MNYSYIKTVFPTFENTNSFNSTLFNELNSQIPNKKTLNVTGNINNENINVSKINNNTDTFYLTETILPGTSELTRDVISESTKLPNKSTIESAPTFLPMNAYSQSNISSNVTPMVKNGIAKDKDNLHYYPNYESELLQQNKNITVNKKNISFENFNSIPESQSTQSPVPSNTVYPTTSPSLQTPTPIKEKVSSADICNSSYEHITQCAQCKEMLYKNFNYEHKQNNYNEEIFELVSYCIFAIFILLLLEK